jgi:hypothetical protein
MKDGLQASNKMNSLARSNASLYGNKDDLYDRLRRHAYQGKKSGKTTLRSTVMIRNPDRPVLQRSFCGHFLSPVFEWSTRLDHFGKKNKTVY